MTNASSLVQWMGRNYDQASYFDEPPTALTVWAICWLGHHFLAPRGRSLEFGVTVKCLVCDNELGYGSKLYCSRKCQSNHKTIKICAECGKEFLGVHRSKATYCSKLCNGRHYAKQHPEMVHKKNKAQEERRRRIWKERYENEPEFREHQKKLRREWKRKNRHSVKGTSIRKYGMSVDDMIMLLRDQEHKCAICGHSDSTKKQVFPCIDHDHESGLVRGILCSLCNHALGQLRDSIPNLLSAIEYLKNPPAAKHGFKCKKKEH